LEVVFDEVEHDDVELAALEAVSGADIGWVGVPVFAISERFEGSVGLIGGRGDNADFFTSCAVLVG
jgi:hypothetical protein